MGTEGCRRARRGADGHGGVQMDTEGVQTGTGRGKRAERDTKYIA